MLFNFNQLSTPPHPLKRARASTVSLPATAGLSPPSQELEDGPSVFNMLNVFRCQWFLHRDHLTANILSTQVDKNGHFMWVNFLPAFHTHLVQWALALLPPLCPVVKGKCCMFVFILKVLDGDGRGTFFNLPKKQASRHHHCSGKWSEMAPLVPPSSLAPPPLSADALGLAPVLAPSMQLVFGPLHPPSSPASVVETPSPTKPKSKSCCTAKTLLTVPAPPPSVLKPTPVSQTPAVMIHNHAN